MNRLVYFIIIIILSWNNLISAGIEKEEKIQQELRFSTSEGTKKVSVNNVVGLITVNGYTGKTVKLTVYKTITARSESNYNRALEEVQLDITENGNVIDIYVDGPFRCKDKTLNYRGWRHYGYEVKFDFELQVPFNTDLCLKTVNDGEIAVKDVNGQFDVKNINSGIDMTGIKGFGNAHAVNGDVTVQFNENPKDYCYFGSINGEIKVYFQTPLSADFRLKTFNGDVYSDYEVTYLKLRPFQKVTKRGKTSYKCDPAFGVTAGNGGAEIEFDSFNGDIYILESKS